MERTATDILLTASKRYESVRAGERQDEMKANRDNLPEEPWPLELGPMASTTATGGLSGHQESPLSPSKPSNQGP